MEKIYIESQCSDDKMRNLSIEIEDAQKVSLYGEYFNDDDYGETYYLTPKEIEKVKNWMKDVADSGSPDEVLKQFHLLVDI